jgi:hypothetical protein
LLAFESWVGLLPQLAAKEFAPYASGEQFAIAHKVIARLITRKLLREGSINKASKLQNIS